MDNEVELNEAGDVVICRSDQLQALAGAGGLALVDDLQRHGRADIVELTERLGLGGSDVERSLARLAAAGLAEQRDGGWSAPGSGLLITIPAELDEPGMAAARSLYGNMMDGNLQRVARWLSDDLHELDGDQVRSSGAISATVRMTADEIDAFQERVDEMLLPYLESNRAETAAAARIRLSLFIMPQPDSQSDASEG